MSKFDELVNLKNEISQLRIQLSLKEALLIELEKKHTKNNLYTSVLSSKEITRYSRQMIMPFIGLTGQLALKSAKILIVGMGGLGCPAALYLASAGVGEITIMDADDVECSNLHRQVLHVESTIGVSKVESASSALRRINSEIKIIPLKIHANSSTIQHVVKGNKFDVVIDGTDNVPSRYLLNDACVLNNIPLVSGSALQMEGQLTVYNYRGGPCYRCLFPKPPPAHTVTNCGDGGVLGAIPGIIGVLQALETIKIITKSEDVLSGRLLVFDGTNTSFRNIKLRSKKNDCDICGTNPKITTLIDHEEFCGLKATDNVTNISILNDNQEIDVEKFAKMHASMETIIDVRPELEYEMCKLSHTINFPYTKLKKEQGQTQFKDLLESYPDSSNIYVICRRGNDSQRTVELLKTIFPTCKKQFFNVKGGLHAFAKFVDTAFPVY